MSVPAVADGSLRDIDKACDKIDYSENCENIGFIAFLTEISMPH